LLCPRWPSIQRLTIEMFRALVLMALSFAGVTLNCAVPASIPEREFEVPAWPGEGREGFPFPVQEYLAHNLKINTLVWPAGASRFAVYRCVIDEDQLNLIRPNLQNGYGTLLMTLDSDVQSQIQTQMWMLPPRPLHWYPGNDNLYLMTLVDQRYWWWCQDTGNLTVTEGVTQWADLYAAAGVSVTPDAVAAAYLTPTHDWQRRFVPIPLFLDAVAYACGQRIVVNLDGSVQAQNSGTWIAKQSAELALDRIGVQNPLNTVAGGIFTVGDLGQELPSAIQVAFPRSDGSYWPISVTLASLNLPQFQNPLTSNPGLGMTPNGSTKTFRHAQKAYFCASGTTPDNQADLTALATQIATDWYLSRYGIIEYSIAGIFPVGISALMDRIDWDSESLTTSIFRAPWNDLVDTIGNEEKERTAFVKVVGTPQLPTTTPPTTTPVPSSGGPCCPNVPLALKAEVLSTGTTGNFAGLRGLSWPINYGTGISFSGTVGVVGWDGSIPVGGFGSAKQILAPNFFTPNSQIGMEVGMICIASPGGSPIPQFTYQARLTIQNTYFLIVDQKKTVAQCSPFSATFTFMPTNSSSPQRSFTPIISNFPVPLGGPSVPSTITIKITGLPIAQQFANPPSAPPPPVPTNPTSYCVTLSAQGSLSGLNGQMFPIFQGQNNAYGQSVFSAQLNQALTSSLSGPLSNLSFSLVGGNSVSFTGRASDGGYASLEGNAAPTGSGFGFNITTTSFSTPGSSSSYGSVTGTITPGPCMSSAPIPTPLPVITGGTTPSAAPAPPTSTCCGTPLTCYSPGVVEWSACCDWRQGEDCLIREPNGRTLDNNTIYLARFDGYDKVTHKPKFITQEIQNPNTAPASVIQAAQSLTLPAAKQFQFTPWYVR
jgi:hypothetical protein